MAHVTPINLVLSVLAKNPKMSLFLHQNDHISAPDKARICQESCLKSSVSDLLSDFKKIRFFLFSFQV